MSGLFFKRMVIQPLFVRVIFAMLMLACLIPVYTLSQSTHVQASNAPYTDIKGVWKGQGTYYDGRSKFNMLLNITTITGKNFLGTLQEDTYKSIVNISGSITGSGKNSLSLAFTDPSSVNGGQIQLNCTYSATISNNQMKGTWRYPGHAYSDGALSLTKMAIPNKFCATGTTLSGAVWVSRFPTSNSTSTLTPPFRDQANNFINALHRAGASVEISATYRPLQRAYLMHYAYEIARKGLDPKQVPARADVSICWAHVDKDGVFSLSESKKAASEMVKAYHIVHEPALTSNHTKGLAVDMTISWHGTLQITDANGKIIYVSTTPLSGMNTQLWQVGATYHVLKLANDPPHWSADGH